MSNFACHPENFHVRFPQMNIAGGYKCVEELSQLEFMDPEIVELQRFIVYCYYFKMMLDFQGFEKFN